MNYCIVMNILQLWIFVRFKLINSFKNQINHYEKTPSNFNTHAVLYDPK
jgi:hypothetical protein